MAVLFDLDGVLADSRRTIIDSVQEALEAIGVGAKPEEAVADTIGPPTEQGFAALLDTTEDDPLLQRAIREYRARYATALKATKPFPGIPKLIAALGADHLLGIATSKPRRYALPTLEAIGLAAAFAYVAGPEPDGPNDKLAMVAEAKGALPGAFVMVGDRRYDIEAAKALGLVAIGVTWGLGSREELSGADVLVDDPERLRVEIGRLHPTPG